MEELIKKFNDDMQKYHKVRISRGYNARFIENAMLKHGGYKTAKMCVGEEVREGFLNLVKRNLLKYSVEALIVQPEYSPLFTEREIELSKNLLIRHGYAIGEDDEGNDENKNKCFEPELHDEQDETVFKEFISAYSIQANEQQKVAIKRVDGATLLLAVPGSGKTTVIVSRVGYMAKCCNIRPSNILTLTFTRAAAREMKERYAKKFKMGDGQRLPHFSTIHSFCKSIIDNCEKRYVINLPRLETDTYKIVRSILSGQNNTYPQEMTVRNAASVITYIKNMMLTEKEIEELNSSDFEFDVPDVYNKYIQAMTDSNLMDFDDQLIYAYDFLLCYPDILASAHDIYRYINVDEAQDTSRIQHKIIELIASRHNNIFMVGDEDQSIYKFRGAYPKALLEFKDTYPKAEILYLEMNFRSTETIVNAAGEFIKQNKDRHQKQIISAKGKGPDIKRIPVTDIKYQYRYLLDKLTHEHGSIAVLYRNNESAIPLINILEINNVPFRVREDGMDLFFTHFTVADIIAFLRLGMNPYDYESYKQIYFKLGAYLSKEHLTQLKDLMKSEPDKFIIDIMGTLPDVGLEQRTRLITIAQIMNNIKFMPPSEAISKIVYEAKYIDWIDKQVASGNSRQTLFQKINTLLAISMEYKNIPDFLNRLNELANFELQRYDTPPNIILSTMHSSKGLEFDKVIIIDAFDGILPSEFAVTSMKGGNREDYEEEVRLFYVAITRARSNLEFISSDKRFGLSVYDSMFIGQLLGANKKDRLLESIHGIKSEPINKAINNVQKEAQNYIPGKRVVHNNFGHGIIFNVNENIVTVKFDIGGHRKFDITACLKRDLIRLI